jgi:hypothetical protein
MALALTTGLGFPAADLGNYIFTANPYQAGLPPKGTWSKSPVPGIVKLETDSANADPVFALCPSDSEMQDQGAQWKFKYADHFVQRALRIPYMYYRKSAVDPTQGMLIRDYFLVGFEGGGAY